MSKRYLYSLEWVLLRFQIPAFLDAEYKCGLEKINYAVAESCDRQGGTVDTGV